jgi:hypothetical protein
MMMLSPLVNMALGVWIIASIFMWNHTASDTLVVGMFIGPMIIGFSLMSFVDRRVRFAATGMGLLLVAQGLFAERPLASHSLVNDVVVGLLVAAVSLIPNWQVPHSSTSQPGGDIP